MVIDAEIAFIGATYIPTNVQLIRVYLVSEQLICSVLCS